MHGDNRPARPFLTPPAPRGDDARTQDTAQAAPAAEAETRLLTVTNREKIALLDAALAAIASDAWDEYLVWLRQLVDDRAPYHQVSATAHRCD